MKAQVWMLQFHEEGLGGGNYLKKLKYLKVKLSCLSNSYLKNKQTTFYPFRETWPSVNYDSHLKQNNVNLFAMPK